jgi:hypothetical protein
LILLLVSGGIWLFILFVLRKHDLSKPSDVSRTLIWAAVFTGLFLRALFIGSTPIYEDDWNRYLWDGAVITQGINPYVYSPENVIYYKGLELKPLVESDDDLPTLNNLSHRNGDFAERINNAHLTTIYPPVAQAVFAISAMIKPFDKDVLRVLYLLSELLALLLLIRALTLFKRSPLWVWLYALNPMVIFTAINGLHMDILLVPLILGAIISVRSHPFIAGILLAGAAAVKLWPLILGPILYRSYRRSLSQYIGYGLFLALVSFVLCLPMMLHVGETSGLSAYSATWQRSSFIFPHLEAALSQLSDYGPTIARLLVAASISFIALYFGLLGKGDRYSLPLVALVTVLALYYLSPTGFPWYIIWFAALIPFVPSYGVALLCVSVSLYYGRFWLGESGRYDLYLNILVPLQFALPLAVIALEIMRFRRKADIPPQTAFVSATTLKGLP